MSSSGHKADSGRLFAFRRRAAVLLVLALAYFAIFVLGTRACIHAEAAGFAPGRQLVIGDAIMVCGQVIIVFLVFVFLQLVALATLNAGGRLSSRYMLWQGLALCAVVAIVCVMLNGAIYDAERQSAPPRYEVNAVTSRPESPAGS